MLKEHFLGNPRFDQTVVAEYIASVEKKMPKATAKALAAVVGEYAPEACPEGKS